MKNKNPGNTSRSVTGAFALILALSLIGCDRVDGVQDGQVTVKQGQTINDTLVFEGTLEKLGLDPGTVSGILAVYRLAKYRVEKICDGQYEGTEIIVDHPIFTGKEFEGININDRVCITVKKTNKMSERFDDNVLRSPTDDIKTYYIAQKEITRWNGPCCNGQ